MSEEVNEKQQSEPALNRAEPALNRAGCSKEARLQRRMRG